MKKIFYVLAAALALAIVCTGCSSDDTDTFTGKNTWLERDFTYTDSSSNQSRVACYFYYSDSAYTNANMNTDITMNAGLTIVCVPSSDSTLNSSLGNKFIYKNFAKGATINNDSDVSSDTSATLSGTFTVSDNLWTAFYAYYTLNGTLEQTSLPSQIKTGSGYTQLTDLTNFSWKKMLAQILVSNLVQ